MTEPLTRQDVAIHGPSVRTRWEERLIRKGGRVKFAGHWYRVAPTQRHALASYASDPPYDGRLDGKRAVFYSYGPSAPALLDSIFLHSFPNPEAEDGIEWPGPNCVDGVFRWEHWRQETP